ncbi:glucosyltransferase [Blastocladiella emersonii ATCC 22665]|nr:glucosyltransferase [Blastocladiella emersonii ATCC 22665]
MASTPPANPPSAPLTPPALRPPAYSTPPTRFGRFLTWCLPLLLATAGWWAVSDRVPQPYMDEPFHVPQAQAYCAGDWDAWDPKLTTPPGLYAVAVVLLRAAAAASDVLPPAVTGAVGEVWRAAFPTGAAAASTHPAVGEIVVPPLFCSVAALRLTSLVLSFLLLALIAATVRDVAREQAVDDALARIAKSDPATRKRMTPDALKYAMATAPPRDRSAGVLAWNALNAWLNPIAVTFYWLFYTETASGVAVLGTYLLARRRWYWLSGILGLFSILVRQTNAVWLCFAAGTTLVARIRHAEARRVLLTSSPLPAWTLGTCPEYTFASWVADHAAMAHATLHRYRAKTVRVLAPATLALAGAVALARANGGLLAGDKDNHVVSLHLPQVMYCTLVVAALVAPIIVTLADLSAYVVFTLRKLRSPRGFAVMTLVFGGMLAAVHWTTLEHPFLLADNRHLTFYVWKAVFRTSPAYRYLAIPGYFMSGWFLYRKLGEHQGSLFISVYALAVALMLVPAPLIEMRYFILPALAYRVHVVEHRKWKLALETAVLVGVNAAVTYVFLTRTFAWPGHPGEVMRFTW